MEQIFYEAASTLPFHLFAYIPLWGHFRFSKKITAVCITAVQPLWILLYLSLYRAGVPRTWAQLTSIPVFGLLFFFCIQAETGKALFLYMFTADYCMLIRALAGLTQKLLSHGNAKITDTYLFGCLVLLIYLLTFAPVLRFIRHTAHIVLETEAPEIWRREWILPCFASFVVLLFTYDPEYTDDIDGRFLFARCALMSCMFVLYYFAADSIRQLHRQIESEEQARFLGQLAQIQSEQYGLLKSRITETRQLYHDLRQHVRTIQGLIDHGSKEALESYVAAFSESLPKSPPAALCQNNAVDALLGFYAEKAQSLGIAAELSVQIGQTASVPEPELCVLLGNLLENAVESCSQQAGDRLIRLYAKQFDSGMISLTIDNTCPAPPKQADGQLLSNKHGSCGIGTQSATMIAQRYHGDARFEWKDGMFLVSVLLNP